MKEGSTKNPRKRCQNFQTILMCRGVIKSFKKNRERIHTKKRIKRIYTLTNFAYFNGVPISMAV